MQLRNLSILAAAGLITVSVWAENFGIVQIKAFDDVAMAVNTTNYMRSLDMESIKPTAWTFSIQLSATNQGTIAVAYELSNDGTVWAKTSNIVTGFSITNSPGLYAFTTERAKFLRLRALATGTNAILTGWLVLQ